MKAQEILDSVTFESEREKELFLKGTEYGYTALAEKLKKKGIVKSTWFELSIEES